MPQSLRDQLLTRALGSSDDLVQGAVSGALSLLSPSEVVDAEARAADPAVLDPDLAEALERSNSLSFSKTELAVLRTLNYSAIQSILSSGSAKEKIAAAKLVVLLQKIERDSYLELRAQSRKAQDAGPRTLVFADPAYLGKIAAAAASSRFSIGRTGSVIETEQSLDEEA